MIHTYLKIAFRNIIKQKAFSLINIFGLALSMSICLLIISIILGLCQYDRFHVNYDRIYRVLSKRSNEDTRRASSPMPVRYELMQNYTGIEKVATFKKGFGGDASYGDTTVPLFGYFCSNEFFEVFSFSFKKGSRATALQDPFSVILTEESAEKLFGGEDPIGKIVRFNERGLVVAGIPNKNRSTFLGDYTVTGILNTSHEKSHIEFDILASLSTLPLLELQGKEKTLRENWQDLDQTYHYVLLDHQKNENHLKTILEKIGNSAPNSDQGGTLYLYAQPLSKITPGKLYRNPVSYRLPIQVINILITLGAIVILSACFNYTNLSIAGSLSRAKEIGVRKLSGANKLQITGQFIGESIMLSITALIFAIGILKLLQPAFNSLWFTRYIKVDMADNFKVYLVFLSFSVLIGIIAGIIPALFLSSFKPIHVLKDIRGIKLFRKIALRKALIVLQFSSSLFFIITTLLFFYQLRYLQQSDYGFNSSNLINVSLQGIEYDHYLDRIKSHAGIMGISGSSIVPAVGGAAYAFLKDPEIPDDSTGVSAIYANNTFIDNFELTVIAGSNFNNEKEEKEASRVLINEKAVLKLGFDSPYEIIGRSYLINGSDHPVIITGVLKDFHYSNLVQDIGPLMIRNIPEDFRYVNVRYIPGYRESVLSYLENQWKELNKDLYFDSGFMDQQLKDTNALIGDVGFILGILALIAVSIACLGLLGMVIFVIHTKTREVGIRKVHGASMGNIIWILSRVFVTLLLIAILIATPFASFLNNLWLTGFAVRVNFGFEILGLGILIMLTLGLATIFSQTIRSANCNPVDILKCE